MKEDRIKWIDGLRGIACICIFIHHFILGFYPAAFFGNPLVAHISGSIEQDFSQSSISFLVNGDFWVSIFCLVSGFAIAWQVLNMQEERQFANAVIRRYPRLMLPVFIISIIVFVMLQLQLFYNVNAANITQSDWLRDYYQNKTTWQTLFFSPIVDTWFVGMETVYSNAFWMLNQLFLGSFLTYLLAAASRKMNKNVCYLYVILILIFLSVNQRYATFVFGLMFAYLYYNYREIIYERKIACKIIGCVMFFNAVILGGYPSAAIPTNYYHILNNLPARLQPVYFYHMLGAASLFLAILLLQPVAKLLSKGLCIFLGKISYSLYLIHIPIIYSLGSLIFVRVFQSFHKYHLATISSFVVSLLFTIVLSYYFHRYIEVKLNIIIKKWSCNFFK